MSTSKKITRLALLEEEVVHLKGRIDTLTSVCEYLVASHPNGPKFAEILSDRAKKMAASEKSTNYLQLYMEGATRFGFDFNLEEVLGKIASDHVDIISKQR
jgi:hypothetical protein